MADKLARCFESNATRFQTIYEEIFRKYDREFPDDDIVELRHSRIIHNRGVIESMPVKKVGFANYKKHGRREAGTDAHESRMEPGHGLSSSPESEKSYLSTSEKSFISVNCSRWANNIEEESDPSDAETLTSGSDNEDSNDSWEDETPETTPIDDSEEADDTRAEGAGPAASDQESEEGDEAGGWLSIRRHAHLTEGKHSSRYGRTQYKQSGVGHSRSAYKSSYQDRFFTKRSPKKPANMNQSDSFLSGGFLGEYSPESPEKNHHGNHGSLLADRRRRGSLSLKSPHTGKRKEGFSRKSPQNEERREGFSWKSPQSGERRKGFSWKSPQSGERKEGFNWKSLQSGDLSRLNMTERIGPPRRVKTVNLSFERGNSAEVSDSFSLEPQPFMNSTSLGKENHGGKMVFSETGKERRFLEARLVRSEVTPSYSGCDEVDFYLSPSSPTHNDQTDFSPSKSIGITSHKYNAFGTVDTVFDDKIDGAHREPHIFHSSPRSSHTFESTFTISRHMPANTAVTDDNRMPASTGVEEDGELSNIEGEEGERGSGDKQNTDKEQGCGRPEAVCSASTGKLAAQGCSSQVSLRSDMAEQIAASNYPSCTASKQTEGMGSVVCDDDDDNSPEASPLLGSTAAQCTDPVGTVDLKGREASLLEIKKDLDRLSAIFNSIGSPRTQKPRTPVKPSKQFGEKEMNGKKKEREVLSGVQPEVMEVSPICQVQERLDDPQPNPSEVISFVSRKSQECACEVAGKERFSYPHRTFIVSDKTDQQNSETEAAPQSSSGLDPSINSSANSSCLSTLQKGHVSKPKRKFCPGYKPISTEEIEKFLLDTDDSESVIKFLKEKHMNSPEPVKTGNVSVQPCSKPERSQMLGELRPDSTNASLSSTPCKPEKRCGECCQVLHDNTEIEKMNNNDIGELSAKSPVVKPPDKEISRESFAYPRSKMSFWCPKVAESKSGISNSQTEQCLAQQKLTVFQSTPGETFRNTLRYLSMTKETGTELTVRDKASCVVKTDIEEGGNQASLKTDNKDKKTDSCCKARFFSVSRAQTAKSARLVKELQQPESFSNVLVSSFAEEKPMESTRSAVNPPLFLPVQQSPDCKAPSKSQRGLSRSVDEHKHFCQCPKGCNASRNSGSCTHQADFWGRTNSGNVSHQCDQERLPLVTASGDNPLSLLSRMEELKTAPTEKSQRKYNRETENKSKQSRSESGLSKVTVTAADSTERKVAAMDSRPTFSSASQQKNLSDTDKLNGRACVRADSPSHRYRISSGTVNGCWGDASSPRNQGIKQQQAGQIRTQASAEDSNFSGNSYSYSSLSVTPQGQCPDANQSTTPSKLMTKLSLSDGRSPVNVSMNKHCDKLSRLLLLDSSEEGNAATIPTRHSQYNRQLKLGTETDTQGPKAAASDQSPQCESLSWKIFRSRNSKPLPQHVALTSPKSPSCYRFSSPQKDASASVPLAKGQSERNMVRISSSQVGKILSSSDLVRPLDFVSPPVSSYKRSFVSREGKPSCVSDKNSLSSPLKRRRVDPAHGTSTPSKKNNSGKAKFAMEESLSTIAGDDSFLNNTVHSSNIFPFQDDGDPNSNSEEEDEITLIPE